MDAAMGKRLTVQEFVTRANKVHAGRYEYSQWDYVNTALRIEIVCPEHGAFLQTPETHLAGRGCQKCGVAKNTDARRSNTKDFITKARAAHGEKYDYSRVDYVNTALRIEIVCPDHGTFLQAARGHLQGKGCQKCGGAKNTDARRSNTKDFITKARAAHGEKYDYSRVDYLNSKADVEINCPDHGDFLQTPNNHLLGHGCPRCQAAQQADARRSNTKDFITKARAAHGEKYDYSRVDYLNSKADVEINCPDHGTFLQAAGDHLQGKGCPKCVGRISKAGTAWLDSLGIEGLHREWHIPGTRYHADGYDPVSNTVYEFHGDHFHGWRTADPDWHSTLCKQTASELWAKTLRKEIAVRLLGYNYVSVWEHERVAQCATLNLAQV